MYGRIRTEECKMLNKNEEIKGVNTAIGNRVLLSTTYYRLYKTMER